ncbi:MAG: sulfite exporter TauE/SafE family protein [Saccharospirillaceae bacterium]|nr:sulfite exporter TauE/SafE family protein [Saccharospirillaceae bacterium]MCD8532567.1 sulfite exporter TauE/SafE family protein [Saccharospirillaceae bacterium]
MIEPLSLLTAFLLGLFGSSHCLVMCGGIAAAIGSNAGTQRIRVTLLFNTGRILSYSIAGLIVASAGLWLQSQHHWLMLLLRTLAALMLILMGLYIARWSLMLTRIEQLGQGIWKYLQPLTRCFMQSPRAIDRLWLGMLWGWLPCGLIYSTLSWVAANGQPLLGAAAMFAFGLGTLPALFASTLAANVLTPLLSDGRVRQIAGGLLIGFGLWTAASVWLLS